VHRGAFWRTRAHFGLRLLSGYRWVAAGKHAEVFREADSSPRATLWTKVKTTTRDKNGGEEGPV
jgi:hypothetical protein